MNWSFRSIDTAKLLSRFGEEQEYENRLAIHLIAVMGLPLSVVNFTAQYIIVGDTMPLAENLLMFGYFLLLNVVDRWLLPAKPRRATLLLYLLEAPPIILAILLGTVWDPTHQATTILIFLMAFPVFILDRPWRVMAMLAFWTVLFLPVCAWVKSPELFLIDAVHVAEFFIAALAIVFLVLRVRMQFLSNLYETRYQLHHDLQTDCLSRYALKKQTEQYLNRPLVLLLADMDQLRLHRDFYGHGAADAMVLAFSGALMETFGRERSYRYGGDELLCVCPEADAEECLAGMERCRETLRAFTWEDKRIQLSFSVGYVTGTPQDEKQLRDMIQLADIYAHLARNRGLNRTRGGAFSDENLYQGILESNLTAEAGSYEISRLTGLPSMSFFIARSNDLLSNILDVQNEPVIGYIKLLHMRGFNNEYGYAQGDELIARTASLLAEAFPRRQLASITAGQFSLLCYKNEVENGLRRVYEALQEAKPGFRIELTAGFAQYDGTESAISLLDKAKLAQKRVDPQSGRLYRFYDAHMDEERRFRQYLINHLDEAIEKKYLKVYYQPIARAVTGEVCNEEALCRWADPRYGFLTPYRFIPTLEENALMYKVNLFVVRQVLEDMAKKRSLGVPVVPVSVNLSRRDFERCDMVEEITALVDASGFPRSILKIEITESAFISDPALLKREVDRFHEKGFDVWLDDFGSEYSTLNLLQELDFDLIKIDMQFMKNFSAGGKNYIIVSNIIDMAKRMGIATLTEGVETREHLQLLRKLGCEKIQGYLFNKPNTLEYIVERALAGTGLRFEDPAAVPYYEDIGRIDLSEPLSGVSGEESFDFDEEIPAGILERRDGRLRCLRWTERYMEMLRRRDLLEEGEARWPLFADPAPAAFMYFVDECLSTGGWVSFRSPYKDDGHASIYLHRVSEHSYRGAQALLIVVLPTRGE